MMMFTLGGGLDPDVVNYITANGQIDTTFINALNTEITGIKEDLLYSRFQCCHIYFENATKSKVNFVNPSIYELIFYGGGIVDNYGFLGNGLNAFSDSQFIPNDVQDVNSNGFTVVIGTNNTPISSDTVDCGAFSDGSAASFLVLKNISGQTIVHVNGSNNFLTISDIKGIWTAQKHNERTKLFHNGTLLLDVVGDGTLPLGSFCDLALNITPGGYGHSNQRIQKRINHAGYEDSEIILLHSRIDTFEATLGRKTW